jgi:RNA 2',3'-cyclic 3'-phosphodiesterase
MRLFVAVELPQPVRQHLVDVQSALRPLAAGAAWVAAEKLHLTVKFLGEVDDGCVAELCTALDRASGDPADSQRDDGPPHPPPPCRPSPHPPVLRAGDIKCFPPRGPVRIVAAGLEGDVSSLRGVHQRVERACAPLGFGPEGRAYRPHVTLARARRPLPPVLRQRLSAAAGSHWPGPDMLVDELVLMQSTLKPSGSEYVPLARFGIGSH